MARHLGRRTRHSVLRLLRTRHRQFNRPVAGDGRRTHDIPFERVRLVLPDTDRTPDQYVSSGSRTISAHSRPIRIAAAEARAALIELAVQRLGVASSRLTARDGEVFISDEPERRFPTPNWLAKPALRRRSHRKGETRKSRVTTKS